MTRSRCGRLRAILVGAWLGLAVIVAGCGAVGAPGAAVTPGTATARPAAATSAAPAVTLGRSTPRATATPRATPMPRPLPSRDPVSGLPVMDAGALPTEAIPVIAAIEAGGPFAHGQDGTTFQNREGLLPQRPRGYYREYTVPTPGSQDRGARRIVMGWEGEMYYTDDHYESFRRVLP